MHLLSQRAGRHCLPEKGPVIKAQKNLGLIIAFRPLQDILAGSVLTEWVGRGGEQKGRVRSPESLTERLGDGLSDPTSSPRTHLPQSEKQGRSQQCAWNGTSCSASVFNL